VQHNDVDNCHTDVHQILAKGGGVRSRQPENVHPEHKLLLIASENLPVLHNNVKSAQQFPSLKHPHHFPTRQFHPAQT
jgi:hypothetical protein